MQKKGLSTIVVTLIIILISLVAVGIIWVVVRDVIQIGTKEVTIGQFTLDAKIKDVNVYNFSNNVSLTLKRNPGVGEFNKMNFVFYDGKSSEVITQPVSLNELEEKWFMFHLGTINVSNLISISIFPYVKQDEKEILGNILDKYTVNTQTSIIPICTPLISNYCSIQGYVCGNWGNGSCFGNLNCGACGGATPVCNSSGRCVASCTPLINNYCSVQGYECGYWGNNTCSGNLSCGTCSSQATCPSGTCVCNSGWGDCNNDNACECNLTSSSCTGGGCVVNPIGNIIYALSCNYNDVNNSVSAANPGDTVRVPAGSCIWNSALLITKGIYLIGAGIGETVITNGISSGGYLLKYNPKNYSTNDAFRLSGFEFNANSKQVLELGSGKSAPFTLQTKVRIDNNKFTNNGSSIKGQAIYNLGSLYGVVDNNILERMGYPIAHSFGTSGDNWWANSPQNLFMHGSEYYMYFEDNIFNLTALGSGAGENILTNGEYASRYVFRYNTITNIVTSYSLFEMHGQQDEGPTSMPASFGAEIYGNQITHGSNDMIFWKQRSGQSLIFLNNAIGTTTPDNTAYTSSICTCPVNYTALKVTHNSYWWGNRRNYNGAFFNSIAVGGLDCNNLTNIPTLGRDIFSDSSSPGVSCGPFSNLPSACTVGQGYWATSQSCSNLSNMVGANPTTPISGTLYKCAAPNTWTFYYTPYTYPHPLTLI